MVTGWLRRYGDIAAATAIAIGLAVVLAWLRGCGTPAPIPPKDQGTLDSLTITRPSYAAAVETLTVHETTYVAHSRQAARQADLQRASADSITAAADSLERVVEAQQDSNTTWHVVANLRKQEADDLRHSNDSLRSALTFEQLAHADADAKALRAMQRDSVSEVLNQRLAADVGHASQCRVLPFVPCPSRKVALVVGAVGGAIAVYELHR